MKKRAARPTSSILSGPTANRTRTMIFGSIPRTRAAAQLRPPTNNPGPRAFSSQPRAIQGFTLIELLLALVLVLAMASAMVFSFSTLLGGTQLEEGAGQVESLIRFARAHAANSGRKVQLLFGEEKDSNSTGGNGIRVAWEADPLGDPGTYEDL